jgi:putative membrane protein
MMGMGLGFSLFGLLIMIIFWLAVIGLAVWLLASLFPQISNNSLPPSEKWHNDRPETALEILRQRYVRGEISRAEFEKMRRDLLA